MTPKQHRILCVMLANAILAAGDPTITANSAEEAQQADNWRPYAEGLYDLLDAKFAEPAAKPEGTGGPLKPS